MSSIWNVQDKKFCEIDGVRVSAADLGYRCHAHLTYLGQPQYCGKCGRKLHQLHCASCGKWKTEHVTNPKDTATIETYIREELRRMRAYDRIAFIAAHVAEVMCVSLGQMRSGRSIREFNEARRRVCAIARKYDPNVSTELLAEYLQKEPSMITKLLRVSYQIRSHKDEHQALRTIELNMRAHLERQVTRQVV